MSEPIYTRLRVLQYVGTLEKLNEAFELRAVKGTAPVAWNRGAVRIYEAPMGESPQRLEIRWARELVKLELAKAKDYFPDDDSKREGYIAALEFLLEEFPL